MDMCIPDVKATATTADSFESFHKLFPLTLNYVFAKAVEGIDTI
jgi:hypothetical protein